ncbi:cilium assembly protein DZIP1 isoform X5 [Alligator mississippiensis]|uniref:cilium assembly protein DZIP1 isoform X5 n=1 Tax=Alligator mississippiensis TaxID=8496 RepID=UPI002877B414|nr:cilium assembly protein DZIP1 isoform X5 [Alligator mississippiensis]
MPFREHVYYPLDAAMAAPAPAVPTFGFRARQGSPDWRRLSAVDVERVERERDVALLQEHLAHITFCSAEREYCPHCRGPADPLLLKLLRLAQLATEYLLHCQDGLATQLHTLEQALEAARAERDQLGEEAARHGQEVQRLQEECRRRKRMISALQRMLEAGASCHQCRFCEKAFMNYSFLQSHMQRRHPEESHTAEQKKKAQTDKLQDEINKLKEQLQLTKSELEAEQHANMVRFSKECEQQKSKEEEILQAFYKWKEEEKEKLANEIEKVKEMFMQEFKELASRNASLEHQLLELQQSNMQLKSNLGTLKDSQEFTEDKSQSTQDYQNMMRLLEKQESKWTSRVQALHQEHEKEKGQIRELSTKSVANIKPYDVSSLAHQVAEPKSSLPGMHEIEKGDHKIGRSNQHLISALKTHPSLTKELRAVLEQALEEKLESLGIKMGVRGIPSDHLNRILLAIESAREEKEKRMPDMQLIRESLERQISFRIEERSSSSCSRLVSIPHRSSEDKQMLIQLGTTLSTSLEKPVKWTSKTVRPAGQKMSVAENTSTPKPRKHVFIDGVSRRTSSIATPPFSSEDEVDDDDDDITQSYISPELLQTKLSSSSVSNCGMTTDKSAIDWIEDSEKEEEEIEMPLKPSKGAIIQKLTEQVEKTLSNHGNKNKPPGGLNVAEAFVKKDDIQELKFTEVDDDDWDISSVEEESLLAKDERGQKGTAIQKNNGPSTISMVQAWGAPKANMTKEEGLHDADTTSTLKSSLVTVTDWSNSSDL